MAIILTLLGIGLILFVHEGGHYLAARRCGVRVEVFSLGFGPRLFGWKKGETDYRISLLPLGGYVRLAGEEMAGEPRPGDLGAASPNQRLLIFAGGILMNFAFALLVIPLLFRMGVRFEVPIAGKIEVGSPAWQAGVQEGDFLETVNAKDIYAFRSFAAAVALGDSEQITIQVAAREGESEGHSFTLHPSYDENVGFRRVGISPASFDPKLIFEIESGTTSWELGLRTGDRITAVNGVACNNTQDARILLQDAALSNKPIELSYFRETADTGSDFGTIKLPLSPVTEDTPLQVGIRQAVNQVKQIRGGDALPFRVGDIITQAGDRPIQRLNDLASVCLQNSGLPVCQVIRDGKIIDTPAVANITAGQLLNLLWLEEGHDFRVALVPNSPAAQVMKDGDTLLQAAGQPISTLANLRKVVSSTGDNTIEFTVSRHGHIDPLVLSVTPAAMANINADFSLKPWSHIVKRDNLKDALVLGFREAKRMVQEIGATLSGMFSGRVASENLGGIITIGRVAHSFASAGLSQLLFFLTMISIHLGVLNLLPIPALDGGHILFVLLEKLRGKPVSVQTQGIFNLVGVALLLSLMIFATSNDIRMWFG